MQMLLLHKEVGALHVPEPPVALSQQGAPRSPHVAHVPALHFVLAAVHDPVAGLVPQQDWPGPPQVPHEPALQIPPPRPTQAPPGVMQIPETQQPPPLQLLAAQHCVPGSPHTADPPAPPSAPP